MTHFLKKRLSLKKLNKFHFSWIAVPYHHPQFSKEKYVADLKIHICTIFDRKLW